jgi:predicted nucleic acid-binding protein
MKNGIHYMGKLFVKNRIYLDNCCFNRPYDDQANLNVHLEAQAKVFIQNEILKNTFQIAWSFMMDYEISFNPFSDRKEAFLNWKSISAVDIEPKIEILNKGIELTARRIKEKDALHIACAIEAECEFFITTDRGILNKSIPEIELINPIDFIRKLGV